MRLARFKKPWSLGNKHRAGLRPANAFKPGSEPWNKGAVGLHLSPRTEFKSGSVPVNKAAVGDTRLRRDKHGALRALVKVAEPNRWRMRAVATWEAAHGPVPLGSVVHHKNRDTLDDTLDNLICLTRAAHIAEHRGELLLAKVGS